METWCGRAAANRLETKIGALGLAKLFSSPMRKA